MPTVNLAPGSEYLESTRRRQRLLFLIATIVAIAAGTLWLILIGVRIGVNRNINETQGRLRAVENEITKLSTIAERIQLFEVRVASLKQLLSSHVSWDPLLREIERLFPPATTIIELTSRIEEGQLRIVGRTPDIDQLAQTLASLESSQQHPSLFSRPELSVVTQHEERNETNAVIGAYYQFEVILSFDPSVLRATPGRTSL